MPHGEKQKGVPKKVQVARAEARRADIEKLLVLQVSPRQIQLKIAEKHDVTPRCVRMDIAVVRKDWDRQSVDDMPSAKNQLRGTLRRILQAAMTKNDLKAAVSVCDRLAKLDGLNEAVKLDVTSRSDAKSMTLDDKRRRIKEIMAAADARAGVGAN